MDRKNAQESQGQDGQNEIRVWCDGCYDMVLKKKSSFLLVDAIPYIELKTKNKIELQIIVTAVNLVTC